jgi:Tfp pilus assembly protein PilF
LQGNRLLSLKISRLVSAAWAPAVLIALLAGCPGTSEGDAKRSQTRLDLAKDFLSKHQLEAAEAEVEKAIAFQKGNDEAYNVRGLIYYLRALDVQRLLEIDACLTGVDAEALRDDLEQQLGRADADFARATELAPDYGEAWSNRGAIANLLGEHDRAAELLTKALESPARLVNPGLTRAHLGWAYFHKADHVRAAKELRQAAQFQPGMCVPTYRLGRVYFAREEWEKAAEQFQDVSEQPACGSQEASLFLMLTRLKQGLSDEAAVARTACLALSPRSCVAARCRAEGASLGPASGSRDGAERAERAEGAAQGARPAGDDTGSEP